MLPYGVGVAPDTPVIRDLIRHEQSGLLVDPRRGVVYGSSALPIGSECQDGYVRLGQRLGLLHLYAHRLIWETVYGAIPSGMEIDHLNGRKADNRIRNLDLVTRSENQVRAYERGLARSGESHPNAKLTQQLVLQIRDTDGGVPTRLWARLLSIDPSTVRAVRQNRSWRHVKPQRRSRRHSPRVPGDSA